MSETMTDVSRTLVRAHRIYHQSRRAARVERREARNLSFQLLHARRHEVPLWMYRGMLPA